MQRQPGTTPQTLMNRMLCPISRLPDDTLYAVFEVLRSWICFPGESEDVPYDPLPKSSKRKNAIDVSPKPRPLWTLPIVVSHVCTRWRTFALASPRLWSFIRVTGTFPNRLMMVNFLERSQQIPLSVLFTEPAASVDNKGPSRNLIYELLALTSELGDVSPRIRELGVVLPPGTARMILEALTDSPVSNLEKLWLDAGLRGSKDRYAIQLLNVNPMSVRTLHARQIPMMWIPFEGLIRLELSSGPAPTLPALLATLRNSPRLEVLQLRIPSFRRDDDVPRGNLPVQLSHLRELLLSVEQGEHGAFSILPHIAFPVTTEVDIHFTGRNPDCLYERNESLRRIAASVEDISIYVDPFRGVTLESDDPLFTIDYDGLLFVKNDDFLQETQLREGLLAVPLPALTHVSLSILRWTDEIPTSLQQLNLLFSAMPTITHLSTAVHPKYIQYIAATLRRPADATEEGDRSMRCPKLRRWTITWCEEEPSIDDFWLVERCCAARAGAGVPIGTLETTVAVPEVVIGSLRRSVENVSESEGF